MNPREQQDKLAFFAACGKAVARSISVGFNQACIRALQTQKAKSARVAFRQESRYFAVDFIMKIAHLVCVWLHSQHELVWSWLLSRHLATHHLRQISNPSTHAIFEILLLSHVAVVDR